jgi:hypothetical protein
MKLGSTVDERVARGMALLDKRNPGWRTRINLRTLNVETCDNCVLGQVYGDYFLGIWKLRLPLLGFRFGFQTFMGGMTRGYPQLNAAWKQALTAWPVDSFVLPR